MKKQILKSGFFLKCLMVLLAIGWSTSAVKADYYWQIRVVAICDGLPAQSIVGVGPYKYPYPAAVSNDYTMPEVSNYMSSDNPYVRFAATAGEGETFCGWYLDSCCTQLLHTSATHGTTSSTGALIQRYTTPESVQIQTIYAKFTKGENVNWTTIGKSFLPDIPSAGNYYILHSATGNFLYYDSSAEKLKASADINDALLFTLTRGEGGAATISAVIGNETKYLNQDGTGLTESSVTHTIEYNSRSGRESYRVILAKDDDGGPWYWHAPNDNVNITTYATGNNRAVTQCWFFIPEATVKNYTSVYGKKSDGSVTISESPSPTAQGTAYVKFRVSTVGNASQHFTYTLPNGSSIDGPWALGEPTRCGSYITVPVIYTAQNIHFGSETPASTTTVTITSTASSPTQASAVATAYVDLQPKFALMVDELDWSSGGESFSQGQEIAASEKSYLQNKLVIDPERTTSVAEHNATWKATIIGTNANQFKFANGTQTVTGVYSASLLDVIYAPTTSGYHQATLHIVTSYTDGAAKVLKDSVDIALGGLESVSPIMKFSIGDETGSSTKVKDFGDIFGTSSASATVNMVIANYPNLSKTWSGDAAAFGFDPNSIDLTKISQDLTFTVHHATPVTENTSYEATLTIKSGETTIGTLTLQYTAKPRITTTVTWNWEELVEDGIYTNPITTNSDANWTLIQRDGNGGMTYDAETKSITTEYMHHESGYTATFELEIPQTDAYTALTDTFTATIVEYIPPVIEINSQTKYNTYVEANNWVSYDASLNAINVSSDKFKLKWSGQSTIAFDFSGANATTNWTITEIYEDGTERKTYDGPFYNGQHHEFAVSPNTYKLQLKGNNKLKNVRYFEYDTIMVKDVAAGAQAAIFVEVGNSGTFNDGTNKTDITATFANKREVTVSLNADAQPFFELRAEGKETGSSLVFGESDGLGVHKMAKDKVFTVAIKDGANIAEAKAAAGKLQVILKDNYTYNSETVILPIALEASYEVTYKANANGVSYKVTYHDDMEHPHTVSASDYEHTVTLISEANCTATLSEPTPASGYMFRGWKLNGELVSCNATCTLVPASGATVEPIFVAVEEAVYGLGDARFADLDEALSTAGSIAATKPVVVLLKDVTLSEPATHTIPADVTLLIPYKADFNELQVTPEITTTATPLSAYRTLTLKEGVNIVCNGTICVSAKIMAAGGGNKSAYTTGECGVINMVDGGHIELNNGAHLYCWGYIKGQDMDQGNNTQGTGTITANNGAIVHENFELGDWRGGTASSDIYTWKDSRHLFPFQSYALQNIEIPTTYTYGSKLVTFMAVNTGFGSIPFAVSMIGSEETLFLLKDAGSVIRKWYDPTTDLTCYELSGTAQLDQLVMNLPFVGNFESGDCNLPISNSMHIILKDDLTLSKRLMQQAGSIIEIKSTATVNLENEFYMYDKDQWGKHIHDFYFRSFNNLTSHKDRGDEKSKDGLEDAKFIIDGVLNVQNGGKLYATAGGANIMGNGGGEIHFVDALPAPTVLWAVDTLGGKPYIKWVSKDVKAANLCNEDGSYTKSEGFKTYYNIHGRWFYEENKDPLPDHTYDFYYLNNGNTGVEDWTAAVYSHDKTGLEARMKWFNVEADDACENWWVGTSPAALYNYTLLNDWHQFMETETTNVYSASNNVLYRKIGCDWAEEGYIDENCLYTFEEGGVPVKKALVDGHFVPLTSNGYDPAYHKTDDATKYYICFQGCNWHPATPYTGESKAYTIHPEDEDLHYIWFNGDWMNVLRDEPFFYTEDEQTNVRTYYEYINGEWEIATPYVSVRDAAETRTFYMIKEAFNVAQIKKNATITLLRDIPNVAEVLTYSTQNTTCTLDLNGHSLSGNIVNLITVNAPGATFTITDNADLKIGKIGNTANKAVYVQKGTLVVANGTIESAGTYAIDGASGTTITINGGYFAAATKCVNTAGSCSISGGHFTLNNGLATYAAAHKYPFETTDPKYKYEVSDAWTITFMNGETTLQTLHLKPSEMPVYTANEPTKDNQHFTGWDPAIAAATADVTYQAQFEAIGENKSRVTLNSNGGNEGLQYVYVTTGSTIGSLPEGTTKDGYIFAGWWTTANGGTQLTAETTISADITYYAHYTKASFTLTWDANGGELSGEYTHGIVEFGAAITAPTATMAGHTCLGWNATPAATMPAHDVTYTAQWSVLVKHYQQNLDGSYPASPTETEEASGEAGEYVTPAAKTYDGFITPATQTVQIGVNTEVTYQYARREYTIILDANGGECATASIEVLHGATPTLPEASKEGYTFTGWFTKAVGGDQITNETVIQRNIGTLYAQYNALNVTAPLTISDTREVTDLRITTTGSLMVTGKVTADNLILEATSDVSGQLDAASEDKLDITNAFFDWKPNGETGTASRTWYAIAVPWEVDAANGIFLKETGRHLVIGQDFDLIYYSGSERASQGNKPACWKYVQHDANKIMHPGQLYMMYFDPGFKTIRFAKKSGSAVLYTDPVSVSTYSASDDKDANWNGIANPKTYYASLSAGTATYAQVLNNGNLDDYFGNSANPVYQTINLASSKFTVGKPLFVQATEATSVVVTKQTTAGIVNAAPRRAAAAAELPKGIAAVYRLAIAGEDQPEADNLFVQVAENEKADRYTIGQDLVKGGVASGRAQVWVNRYDAKLSVNTQALSENEATYPLTIQVPANGEYVLSIQSSAISDQTVYLTRNGEAIWNLSEGAYTANLEKGAHTNYGLRVSARAPQITTGIDEAVVDAKGETRKVLINNTVYIIRGENVYSVDGQLVK